MTRDRLEPIVKGLRRVETELPVMLFMADESGKPLETIVGLRRTQRLDWIDVMRKSDLKLNVLFEGVEGRFPEPYKASWTEWRMKYRPELTDDQIRELVFLQLAHKISGRPMAELVKTPTLPMEVLALGKPSPQARSRGGRGGRQGQGEGRRQRTSPPARKKKPAPAAAVGRSSALRGAVLPGVDAETLLARSPSRPTDARHNGRVHADEPTHFGSGWLSGTLSSALGLLGLGAVLCFRYPALLTMPELRALYPLPYVRALLHVVLVAAFLLGVISVCLRRRKTLGAAGIGAHPDRRAARRLARARRRRDRAAARSSASTGSC